MTMMRISNAGIELIKKFEGCRLTAYRDVVGVLTIGWGHTGPDVFEGMAITQAQADQMLTDRLNNDFGKNVNKKIGSRTPTTQAQFDAMVSLAYNIGNGGFNRSSVLRRHLGAANLAAADAFLLWNKAGGRVIPALTRRRREERAMYLSELPGTAPLPTPPAYTRTDAARDMQNALTKLGLYEAAVDGAWGPLSRAAYAAFLEGL